MYSGNTKGRGVGGVARRAGRAADRCHAAGCLFWRGASVPRGLPAHKLLGLDDTDHDGAGESQNPRILQRLHGIVAFLRFGPLAHVCICVAGSVTNEDGDDG